MNKDMISYDEYQDEMNENPSAYGTPDSMLLKMVREAGFKPVGITTMMCEETFIFKGNAEADKAAKMFMPEGWWYGLSGFWTDWDVYQKQMGIYEIDEADDAIHWLNETFKPRR